MTRTTTNQNIQCVNEQTELRQLLRQSSRNSIGQAPEWTRPQGVRQSQMDHATPETPTIQDGEDCGTTEPCDTSDDYAHGHSPRQYPFEWKSKWL